MDIRISLSSEDHSPNTLVRAAAHAEELGFRDVWITDHYHPWIDRQGHSPFVWAVIGGIAAATEGLRVGTGVTCPTIRIHPAIIAQAAATAAVMLESRFWLGVGSGENLNEHILGDRWPAIAERLEMLEEAVEVIRLLWRGGEHSHRGRHYTVENARIYDLPEEPTPIYVSAFGPKAVKMAGRIGDGYVGTSPESSLVKGFDKAGGSGKPKVAEMKCAYAPSSEEGAQFAHDLWPNLGLPGQLSQDLPTPAHFEQAAQLVTKEQVPGPIPHGPDPEPYRASLRKYAEAGFDAVYVSNIGPHLDDFLRFLADEVVEAAA